MKKTSVFILDKLRKEFISEDLKLKFRVRSNYFTRNKKVTLFKHHLEIKFQTSQVLKTCEVFFKNCTSVASF